MRAFKGLSRSAGMAPGTIRPEHHVQAEETRLTVWSYDPSSLQVGTPSTAAEAVSAIVPGKVAWIRVIGLRDTAFITDLCESLGMHPLQIEDIFSTHQRAKQEQSGDLLFVTLDTVTSLGRDDCVSCSALRTSILLVPGAVVTFEVSEVELFGGIANRLRDPLRRIRNRGADYLMQAILDMLVDGFFLALEDASDRIDLLESELAEHPYPSLLGSLQDLRTGLLLFRKSVWPLREVIGSLSRVETELVTADTLLYLRDVYEHTLQVIDTTETLREILAGMVDTYLSGLSNQMNRVMQVLTTVSTVFIPLTFIAGVYGMNFHYMPELAQKWGYPAVLGLMALTAGWMLLYFKRKKWM